jgi:hypothetical protein
MHSTSSAMTLVVIVMHGTNKVDGIRLLYSHKLEKGPMSEVI